MSLTYAQVIGGDSPCMYFPLNDSAGPAVDVSVNAASGTFHGGITTGVAGGIAADQNPAMLFDGTSGYISVPFAAVRNPFPAFSVEAWLNVPTQGNDPMYDCRPASSGASAAGFDLLATSTGVGLAVASANVSQTLITAATSLSVWHYVTGTYDGAQARLFVDAALKAGPTSCPYTANPSLNGSIASIPSGASNWFSGNLQHVAIYPYALTQAQITNHYRAGTQGFGSNSSVSYAVQGVAR